MRRCVDSGAEARRPCDGQGPGQGDSITPDLVFKAVRRAYESGNPLTVIPYPVSSSFFSSIGFRLVEKGPEMALDHEELKKVLADLEAIVGDEKDFDAWDILRDYVEELGQRGPVLVWPSAQWDALIQKVREDEGVA